MHGERDADVVVIGSGFGGAVAALRCAEAGQRVVVLERGPWVTRDTHEVDLDALWIPHRHRFGMNELRSRGRHIVPWLGVGVGGGSHAYAGTLKRAATFAGYPAAIAADDMERYYARAEDMMEPRPYPDYPPYGECRSTQILFAAGRELERTDPELVEDWGPVPLAIQFAPPDGTPGAAMLNKHGAKQRYSDPSEQSLLGGDIDAKNSLDKNYLFVAQRRGAEIRALSQATRIEPMDGGGYRVTYKEWIQEEGAWRRFGRKWLTRLVAERSAEHSITCRRLVLAAGCVGSTELLLRAREIDRTLPDLGPALGTRYTTNGDFLSLVFPARGLLAGYVGLIAAIIGLVLGNYWIVGAGALGYVAGLLLSGHAFDPDIGTTNSDYIRFRGEDGSSQGAYIEGGRYPTPERLLGAIMLSSLGLWRPHRYGKIVRATRWFRRWVPPFGLFARTWPIPLLEMGRDRALGTFRLDRNGRAVIDYDLAANAEFYRYLNRLSRKVAKAVHGWWVPNVLFYLFKRMEIPHNQGGAPMGEGPDTGVVDHAGRVFGYADLMVLDGAILPVSPGPNPAFTILAVAERGIEHALAQVTRGEAIMAEVGPTASGEVVAASTDDSTSEGGGRHVVGPIEQ
ncbi:MAG TPA: GMC oxidoreductase [Kofleriaceae bacterium]|nr:GMC oxidoreductase [Kofleriaceae bacterium]